MAAEPTLYLHSRRQKDLAHRWIEAADKDVILRFSRGDKRTLEQNRRLHALCTHVANQVEWAGAKRSVEAWKDIFTAALRSARHELDVVPGINGGFVLLGMHTASMSVGECNDLMTLIEAFGAEHGVDFDQEDDSSEGPAGANNPPGVAA